MKKKKQLTIKKLSLSKKTISILDDKTSGNVVGGWTQSDIYATCVTWDYHCAPTNRCVITVGNYTCNPGTYFCPSANCPPVHTDPYHYC